MKICCAVHLSVLHNQQALSVHVSEKNRFARQLDKRGPLSFYFFLCLFRSCDLFLIYPWMFKVAKQDTWMVWSVHSKRTEGRTHVLVNDKLESQAFIWALKHEVALLRWKRTKGFEVGWHTVQRCPGEHEKTDTEHGRIIASFAVWGLKQGLKDTVLSLPFCIIQQRRVV